MREVSGKEWVSQARFRVGTVQPVFYPRTLRRWFGLFALVLLLTACTSPSIYQDDRYNPPVYWGQHVVREGETLYSIAWRYGRDYRELGDANDIGPPWTIRKGQVLRLDRRGDPDSAPPSRVASSPSPPKPSAPAAKPSSSSRPAKASRPEPAKPVNQRSQTVQSIGWRWPHVGTVLASYTTSGKVNKGLDIAGNPGDPVKAAAGGQVVYAGNGLLGYGNLVIVNHNEHYLSAYAHNRKILVQEGEDVKAGQVIAELGSSGTDRPKLHFEIRKNGNPVDPTQYLPSR